MTGLPATLAVDVRRQARSGLYAVGILGAVLFGLVGRFVFPQRYAGEVLSGLFLLSLSSTTFIFCAAQVLMDRTEGTLLALRASPLTADAYILSKVITLTLFSSIEALIIYLIAFRGAPLHLLPLALGVLGIGLMYALIGLGLVARHDSVLSFLLPSAALTGTVTQLPVFFVLDVGPPALYYAIPSMGPLLLMLASARTLAPWQWAYALAMTAGFSLATGLWARRRFHRHIALSRTS